MKYLIILLLSLPLFANAQIFDDFEDGDLSDWTQSEPGHWEASPSSPLNGSYSLYHVYDNPESAIEAVSRILCPIDLNAGTTTWKFQVRHGYNPSTSNNWAVFLYSDLDAPAIITNNNPNGYVCGVNYSGSDDVIKLWKVTNGTALELASTGVNWQNSLTSMGTCGFEISRTNSGFFEIRLDTTGGFDNLDLFASVNDNTHLSGDYFAVYYEYTSNYDRMLWLDDLEISSSGSLSSNYDAEPSLPSAQVPAGQISSLANSTTGSAEVFKFILTDQGTSDGLSTFPTKLVFRNNYPANSADWIRNIAGVVIYDGATEIYSESTISEDLIEVDITPGLLEIVNNASKEITVAVYLNTQGIEDGKTIQMYVDANNHGWLAGSNGTRFSCLFPADIVSSVFTINVSATKLSLAQYNSIVGNGLTFGMQVTATDLNSNIDLDYAGNVTLSRGSGNGSLSSLNGLTQILSGGVSTWNDLKYNTAEYFTIQATDAASMLSAGTSSYIHCINYHTQFDETFADGELENNPFWAGDNYNFIIDPVLTFLQLYPPQPDPDTSYLVTFVEPDYDSIEWHFWARMDFDPSSNNYARYYLMADDYHLDKPLNGYFIQIGEPGTLDGIELFRQDGNTVTSICRGADATIADNPKVSVKVRRNMFGEWKVYADYTGNNILSLIAQGTDYTYNPAAFSTGIQCVHLSPSYNNKFFFDDLYCGPYIIDSLAPEVIMLKAVTENKLDVYFNEGVELLSAEQFNHYNLSGIGTPVDVERDANNFSIVHLTFAQNFPVEVENVLTLSGIADFEGNVLTTATASFFLYYPKVFDIVISEIMTDVSPEPHGLPAFDYIELYNRSPYPINIADWSVQPTTSSGQELLPDITIQPDSFLVVVDEAYQSLFSGFSTVAGINSLAMNTEGTVYLYDAENNLVHYVSYTKDFYHDTFKDDGGWSMEMIDPENPCGSADNWNSSKDTRGGTPGMVNTVDGENTDNIIPEIIRASYFSNDTIRVYFTEAINPLKLVPSYFSADFNIGSPVEVVADDPTYTTALLVFGREFGMDTVYTLSLIDSITDCVGNSIVDQSSVRFGIPDSVAAGNVLINEVLFNPVTGGNDFVELYNISSKILDLKNMLIANRDVETGNLDVIEYCYPSSYLFFPDDYLVLSENSSGVDDQYIVNNPKWLVETSLPGYADDTGCVVVMDLWENIIDEFCYSEDMHFGFLSDFNGVSLERIDFYGATADPNNWNSASESIGFATPTYQNSQQGEIPDPSEEEVTVSPSVFSPDNDGFDDRLYITFNLDNDGFVGKVFIYDNKGRLVNRLVNNDYMVKNAVYSWDGLDESDKRCKIGIYIAFVELFNEAGEVKKYKRPFVLSSKL